MEDAARDADDPDALAALGIDLDRVRELVVRSGVRWGLDAPHRAPFHLDGFPQNTWSAGLDRLLLGVTMAGGSGEQEWLGTALPMEEVDSGDVERIGRLAEFVDRLATVLSRMARTPRSVNAWRTSSRHPRGSPM